MTERSVPETLAEQIADLYGRIADLERRIANRTRTGTVAEVDPAKGLARIKLGEDDDGQPFLSPWLPWKEPAMGAIKWHTPPSVGEQVKVTSESGEITDGIIDFSIPSDQNARPSDKGDEHVRQHGSTKIIEKDGRVEIDATVIVLKGTVHLGGEGGKLVHRKDDIDSGGDLAVGSASKVYAL